jgi:2-keto-4-pentenoate hydratase/2-oxohepta-3-ene-1,7-dioic acid hydratase in catechol pathway
VKLCGFINKGNPGSGVLLGDEVVSLEAVNQALGLDVPTTVSELIQSGRLEEMGAAVRSGVNRLRGSGTPLAALRLTAPYTNPPKIWCIGLNYREHASDLDEKSPEEPASFLKPATTLIGPGDTIYLPPESERVTGEAELGVVIGKRCKNIPKEEVRSVIAGFVPVIDMTAEDILRRNPRFLTRAKSFDTFLSIGPFLVTADEIGGPEALGALRVTTRLNGEAQRSNLVANMRHPIYDLVAFHSRVFPWEPGDILLTGTPGAVVLKPGDVVGSEVEGLGLLENPVAAGSPP